MYNWYEVKKERAILVGVVHPGQNQKIVREHLDELALLSDTAGLEVIERQIQERRHVDATYYIGKGKAKHIAERVSECQADIIVFDDELSPGQARNLERLTGVRVLDRSNIILDIFARRAKTREARTQVELAQLQYLLPRLTRMWTHLSRQTGNAGVGLRGPGEKQLELDRRIIGKQISRLADDLAKIEKQRSIRRQHRDTCFRVALLGYTNVGKSTLLNALTDSSVFVEDRLFATLDSTVRRLPTDDDQKILLIDTVGFIRKLPHHLVASFRSTLAETQDADLLLHVIDISSSQFREQIQAVAQVMQDLEIDQKPVLYVFNKIDRVNGDVDMAAIRDEFSPCIMISAERNIFVDELRRTIQRYAAEHVIELEISLPIQQQRNIANIYKIATVLQRTYDDEFVHFRIQVQPERMDQLKAMMQSADSTEPR